MKLILLLILLLFTGCSQTTTYKAKSLGWSKVIEAKTRSLAIADCKDHQGYYTSTQVEVWGGWENNTVWYDSVKLTCTDGFIVNYSMQQINEHYSPIVAEILTKEN